jgi:hypothetical protein
MDTTLDPLRNSELHRALAFARARETYPGIPGDLLLELCDAAWQRAAGDTRDGEALERFERALDVVARSYRVGGGRLSISEVAEDAIPLTALQPYIDAQKRRPAPVEPAPEPVPAPPRRTLSDKLSRVPRLAPAPLGLSLAAGVFGVAAQAGVLEQTPLAPLSFTDRGDAPAPADRASSGSAAKADRGAADAGGEPARTAGAASPSVGELASSHAAAADDGGAATEQAGTDSGATGGATAPSAPLDLASSTAPAPAPAATAAPAPAAPAAPSAPHVPAVQLPEVQVLELGDDEDEPAEQQEPPTQEGGDDDSGPAVPGTSPADTLYEVPEQLPVGVHFPAPGQDEGDEGEAQSPVIQLPGGVQVPVPGAVPPTPTPPGLTPTPADHPADPASPEYEESGPLSPEDGGEAPPTPEEQNNDEDTNPATEAPDADDADPAPVRAESAVARAANTVKAATTPAPPPAAPAPAPAPAAPAAPAPAAPAPAATPPAPAAPAAPAPAPAPAPSAPAGPAA